jgi:hypothetical protein
MNKTPIIICTGCGSCCLSELCPAAQILLGQYSSICPFLLWENGRYLCLLIKTEISNRMEPILVKALGIGEGCSNWEDAKGRSSRLELLDRKPEGNDPC